RGYSRRSSSGSGGGLGIPLFYSSLTHQDLPTSRHCFGDVNHLVAVFAASARHIARGGRMIDHDAQLRARGQLLERELGLDERVGADFARQVERHHATTFSARAIRSMIAASSSTLPGAWALRSRAHAADE